MPFYELKDLEEIPLVEGITIKAVYAEKMSVSFLSLPAYSNIPPHHHENEQIGIVVEGEMEYTIGDETYLCREGAALVIPPNVVHSLRVVSSRPAKLIDIFTPPRKVTEKLKFVEEQK